MLRVVGGNRRVSKDEFKKKVIHNTIKHRFSKKIFQKKRYVQKKGDFESKSKAGF